MPNYESLGARLECAHLLMGVVKKCKSKVQCKYRITVFAIAQPELPPQVHCSFSLTSESAFRRGCKSNKEGHLPGHPVENLPQLLPAAIAGPQPVVNKVACHSTPADAGTWCSLLDWHKLASWNIQ